MFERIVLIADRYEREMEGNAQDRLLDAPEPEYVEDILSGLKCIAQSVRIYTELSDFSENIKEHGNDLVFTIYGGCCSRNRMALVPAICEANNIRYVGADTYARIICQDKALSKILCRRHRLLTPNSVLIDPIFWSRLFSKKYG